MAPIAFMHVFPCSIVIPLDRSSILRSPRATTTTVPLLLCTCCSIVNSPRALRGASIVAGLLKTRTLVLWHSIPITLIARPLDIDTAQTPPPGLSLKLHRR